jgi:hypothetical protein
MYPHDLNCPTDMMKPEPVGWCDRSNHKYYLKDLVWQFAWRGNALSNLRIRVCPNCLDVPNEGLRPILVGPDPVPPKDPRPGFTQSQMNAPGGQPPFATGSVAQDIFGDDE